MFVNGLLLWGLALAAAPVIIHILNKRRYRVHDWAAMDFLLAAQVSNRRRVKFEDLILLLLRMAIIGFLVMAVARPVLRGLAGWREDSRVVVLDDSFSMEAVSSTGKVFDTARESALFFSVAVAQWVRPSESWMACELAQTWLPTGNRRGLCSPASNRRCPRRRMPFEAFCCVPSCIGGYGSTIPIA